jgi:hypothetical protein
MIWSRLVRHAIALGVAALLGWVSALPLAAEPHTNQGGKYTLNYATKFHTNQGGKYAYSGQGSTFHTNPGGKYVYRGYSAAPR